ncbi:STAS/SEC14 domain-containing protein [Haloferula sp.]|uniref:STAS/SEC14 domain-containing protein n=1 Tax=Haloferula sp. TaxID=2497595 RepID=UPI00329E8F87
MITFRLTDTGVLVVQPSGPISADDFSALQQEVDPWLDAGGKLKGLLIDAPDFPGWTDFAGLRAHLGFVRNHHRELPRVAVVSDSRFLAALPKLARHFVSADFRRFNAGETADAIAWLESPEEPAQRVLRHAWFPEEKIVWVTVDGKITTAEYREFLTKIKPLAEGDDLISFLVNLDDLEGAEIGALIADTKFGVGHIKNIKRIAMVGDQDWIKRLTSLPNPFTLEVKAFDDDDEHEAWDWITS